MVFGKKLVQKLKDKGIANAEKVAYDLYQSFSEAAAETAVDTTAETAEKAVCLIAAPVLSGLDSTIRSAVDFNHDGKLG